MTNDITFKFSPTSITIVFLVILGIFTVGHSEELSESNPLAEFQESEVTIAQLSSELSTPPLVDAQSRPSLGVKQASTVSDNMGPPKPEVIAKQVSTKSGLAIKLIVKLAPSWHITSHDPKDEFAFGAEIEFKNPEFEHGAIQWPMPVVKYIESIGVENSYYEGEFEILIPLDKFPKTIQGQEVVFHYQTCTEKLCLAPNFMSTLIW